MVSRFQDNITWPVILTGMSRERPLPTSLGTHSPPPVSNQWKCLQVNKLGDFCDLQVSPGLLWGWTSSAEHPFQSSTSWKRISLPLPLPLPLPWSSRLEKKWKSLTWFPSEMNWDTCICSHQDPETWNQKTWVCPHCQLCHPGKVTELSPTALNSLICKMGIILISHLILPWIKI